MRDQSLIEQQNIAKQAVGAGGLDSSRFAILEAERQKNLNQGIGDLYAKSQANAYTTALGAAQSEQERAQKGAQGMTLAAQGQQGLTQADIGTQLGIGGLQRDQDQKGLDIAYGDFLQEQNKPKEQLGFYRISFKVPLLLLTQQLQVLHQANNVRQSFLNYWVD